MSIVIDKDGSFNRVLEDTPKGALQHICYNNQLEITRYGIVKIQHILGTNTEFRYFYPVEDNLFETIW